MQIIYKQSHGETDGGSLQKPVILQAAGITQCHFKRVDPAKDTMRITTKPHHHTSCEIHLVFSGEQRYLVDGRYMTVTAGSGLLIPPETVHQIVSSATETGKYSVTFACTEGTDSRLAEHFRQTLWCGEVPEELWMVLEEIVEEGRLRREFSPASMECGIFRLLLKLARVSGLREEPLPQTQEEDPRLALARQYVRDNIDRPITCRELAVYCHISQKQLSRLFLQATRKTTADFIRSQKIRRIEKLLEESTLSLRQISEQTGFSSEYHFNSFFTKYAGMPPGAYRKMVAHPQP